MLLPSLEYTFSALIYDLLGFLVFLGFECIVYPLHNSQKEKKIIEKFEYFELINFAEHMEMLSLLSL